MLANNDVTPCSSNADVVLCYADCIINNQNLLNYSIFEYLIQATIGVEYKYLYIHTYVHNVKLAHAYTNTSIRIIH